MSTLKKQFLSYLRLERGCSPLTIKAYGEDIDAFMSYLNKTDAHLSLASADKDVIRDWMEEMMDKGNTASSIGRRLSALRSLYRYCLSHGVMDSDPTYGLRAPKCDKPLPSFVRERDMRDLLDRCEWGDSFKDVRARTIIEMLYETGMRSAELLSLDDDSVDFAASEVKVTGKGSKQRIIPFGDRLVGQLKAYVKCRDANVARCTSATFVTMKGERMSYDQLRYVVRTCLGRVCSMSNRSPHVLRHTFATAMLNHDAGIESVKKLLGHESLKTTEAYTHVTFEKLKKEYKSAHPRA